MFMFSKGRAKDRLQWYPYAIANCPELSPLSKLATIGSLSDDGSRELQPTGG